MEKARRPYAYVYIKSNATPCSLHPRIAQQHCYIALHHYIHTMDIHNSTVATLASQVARFSASKTQFRIYHGSTLSTRKSSRDRNQIIDVSSLNHVIEFDELQKTVLVEPNVPMDKLLEATMAKGFLPKVVMELPNITVGGG